MERIILNRTTWFAVLGLFSGALGVASENPVAHFGDIQQRNLFGLKSPEPKVETQTPPRLPKLILTGITTILGNKRALLKQLPPPDVKPVEPGKELLLMLAEGQREGDVEVLQIDEKAGVVKVSNSGTLMTLTFEKDGPKPPLTPPPTQGITPGIPGGPTTGTMTAGPGVVPPAAADANGNQFMLPSTHTNNVRSLRRPRTLMPGSTAATQPATGLSPTGPTSMPPAVYAQPNNAVNPGFTPEEQQILAEAQRQMMQYPTSNLPNAGSAPAVQFPPAPNPFQGNSR